MRRANILNVVGACMLLLMLITPVTAQSAPVRNDQPVLEFVRVSCGGQCDKEVTQVFADGRYVAKRS